MADVVKTLLVDESQADLRIAQRLSNVGLRCEPLRPEADLSALQAALDRALSTADYDAVLVDYRLDEETDEKLGRPNYRGGSVAAWIKERYPHVPVILVTTEAKLHDWLENNPSVRTLFDFEVMKNRLLSRKDRVVVANQIEDLVRGFQEVKTALEAGKQSLSKALEPAMKATHDEAEQLAQLYLAGPETSTLELARWLLNEVLFYPGMLIGRDEARVRLGLKGSSFDRQDIQEWLFPAKYEGVFGRILMRWWRGRLDTHLTTAAEGQTTQLAGSRAQVVGRVTGVRVRRDNCIWCGGQRISRACALCNEAVDSMHCLSASMDDRPSWSESAVVCFVCIETGRADGLIFPLGSEGVADRVRAGEVSKDPIVEK